jgi:hypothetical protein
MCKRKGPKYQVGDLLEEWFPDRSSLHHIITKIINRPRKWWIKNRKMKVGLIIYYELLCIETGDIFEETIRQVEMRYYPSGSDCGTYGWRRISR